MGATKAAAKAVSTTETSQLSPTPETVPTTETVGPIALPAPKSSLARNNLAIAIVGLVLLYAVAGGILLFGDLPNLDKTPLIWFMVIFPLVSLVWAGWLVTRHSGKLYLEDGAELFNDSTIDLLSPTQQQTKLNEEIEALAEETKEETGYEPDDATLQEMSTTYLIASDLALRKLNLDYNGTLRRHVAIERAPYDGVVVESDKITAVEVKLLPNADIRQAELLALLSRAEDTARRLRRTAPRKRFYLLLTLVVALPPEERLRLRDSLISRLGVTAVNLDLVFFDYGELQKAFAREVTI